MYRVASKEQKSGMYTSIVKFRGETANTSFFAYKAA